MYVCIKCKLSLPLGTQQIDSDTSPCTREERGEKRREERRGSRRRRRRSRQARKRKG